MAPRGNKVFTRQLIAQRNERHTAIDRTAANIHYTLCVATTTAEGEDGKNEKSDHLSLHLHHRVAQ